MTWQNLILRIFSSRYTRSLEGEVLRLRDENRALINSVLSIAGLPPLRLGAEIERERHKSEIAASLRAKDLNASGSRGGGMGTIMPPSYAEQTHVTSEKRAEQERSSSPTIAGQGIVLPANPHRRRSWQQINRILEIEEMRQITDRDNSECMHSIPFPRSNA